MKHLAQWRWPDFLPGVQGNGLSVPWFSQGLVAVWELQLERRGRPERVSVSWEHRGQRVTALCWDSGSLRVFAGDQGGKVSFLRAGSTKLSKVPGLMRDRYNTRSMEYQINGIPDQCNTRSMQYQINAIRDQQYQINTIQ